MKKLTELAEQKGINIALENLRVLDQLDYIFNNINSERLGFCYDSGHQNCRTPNIDVLSLYGTRLKTLHLHDNDGYINGEGAEDQHKLPIDGTIDWNGIMSKLRGAGYSGMLGLEATNFGHEKLSADEFLMLAYERALKLKSIAN